MNLSFSNKRFVLIVDLNRNDYLTIVTSKLLLSQFFMYISLGVIRIPDTCRAKVLPE
jgi:hypothetical protein